MRLGIVSDVHGNLAALDAALAFLDGASVDRLVSPGDLIGYGPRPNECVDRVLGRTEAVVAGNHELIVLGELGEERCTPTARASFGWTRGVLRADVRERLAALPRRLDLGGGVLLAHGSPDDPQEYVRTLEQVRAALTAAEVVIVGHTHEALVAGARSGVLLHERAGRVALPPGERVLVNAGAVGQSRGGRPRAWAGVVDLEARDVEIRALRYDVGATRRALREQGLPEDLCHVPDTWRERARKARSLLLSRPR